MMILDAALVPFIFAHAFTDLFTLLSSLDDHNSIIPDDGYDQFFLGRVSSFQLEKGV